MKWFFIRGWRRFNTDDFSAFASWFVLGNSESKSTIRGRLTLTHSALDLDWDDDVRVGRVCYAQLALAAGVRGEVYLGLPHLGDGGERRVSRRRGRFAHAPGLWT